MRFNRLIFWVAIDDTDDILVKEITESPLAISVFLNKTALGRSFDQSLLWSLIVNPRPRYYSYYWQHTYCKCFGSSYDSDNTNTADTSVSHQYPGLSGCRPHTRLPLSHFCRVGD